MAVAYRDLPLPHPDDVEEELVEALARFRATLSLEGDRLSVITPQ